MDSSRDRSPSASGVREPAKALTLDTSGAVEIPNSGGQVRRGRLWSDLTPFAQGCVRALFAGLPRDQERSCGWCGRSMTEVAKLKSCRRNPQCTKAVREERVRLYSKAWNCRPSANLNALERTGYLAGYSDGFHGLRYGAGYDDPPTSYRIGFDQGRANGPLPLAFSDLSAEALGMILKDCEAFAANLNIPADALAGGWFWDWRQDRWMSAEHNARRTYRRKFPPQTPYLGDDGKIYLKTSEAPQ